MDQAEKNRLYWKCRRGLLELDLVLQKYLVKHPEDSGICLTCLTTIFGTM